MLTLKLLDSPRLERIREIINRPDAPWVDGRVSAGRLAKRVKNNRQLEFACKEAQEAGEVVIDATCHSEEFLQNIMPVKNTAPLFARYTAGMEYGAHVDNATSSDRFVRVDVSVTVFLSDPDAYDGGNLVIGGQVFGKLPAGHAVIYPASSLHCVTPVLRGERQVAVFWVESRIRDAAQRQLLMDLGRVCKDLQDSGFDQATTDVAFQTYNNLQRMWLD